MPYPEGNGTPAAPAADGAAPQHMGQHTGDPDSLRAEALAAAGAVAAHIQAVTATARTEAELSVASLVWIIAAAIVSLLLVVTAWLCLVAAATWWAVDRGLPVGVALLVAGAVHVAVVAALAFWSKSLLGNIGFARTRQLVFPERGKPE
jgi:hypothetical protein